MKRIFLAIVLSMSLFLFLGCKEATETVALDEVTFEKEQVAFVNYSTEFIREDPVENINFYYYEAKPGLPYVDISEFVNLLLGIIDENTEVEINANSVRVWNEYFYTDEEKADYGITEDSIIAYVTFDFLTETVTAPNVDTFDYFSGETETDFSEGLNMVSYTEEELPELSINVADYGFMFFTVEDTDVVKYTIPLSLVGLFLT
ncbi:MAG: hypothetical protein PHI01_03755, partial [Candidatus Izemoplasmatales bacterium]|nr:hypothetical protein [Candidatus Izemoplasmatales bacterium]